MKSAPGRCRRGRNLRSPSPLPHQSPRIPSPYRRQPTRRHPLSWPRAHRCPIRGPSSVSEAIRLTDQVARHPSAGTPATWALLALQHFHFSRLDERIDAEGRIVLLGEQDRSGWGAGAIAEGFRCLERSARGDQLSRYHLEAAIAAEHCRAPSLERTDWARVVGLYDRLQAISRSPVHDLNRAVAVLQASGPEAALEALDALEDRDVLATYYLLHAVEAECHRRAGDGAAAAASLREALRWTRSPQEHALLKARLEAWEAEGRPGADERTPTHGPGLD